MRTVKRNVYYCDHCNKRNLSLFHMRKHEAHCTANPLRICGVCESASISRGAIERFKARFSLADNPNANPSFDDIYDPEQNHDEKIVTWIGEPITLREVRDSVDNCPACILAVLRQTGLNRHYFHLEKFEFKKELRDYLNANRADLMEAYYGGI
jgi:hypothetical protein